MSTTPTTYKGYAKPDPTTETGTWGTVLNDQVFTYVDTNLGGTLGLVLDASNVTLTTAQARNSYILCSGTLTANVEITNPANGVYLFENFCDGDFDVTLTRGVGSAITIPALGRAVIFADATNGARVVAFSLVTNSALDPFPEGTTALFLQAAVPTGWTLSSTYADYLLRLSTATGGVASGSVPVSTLFARTSVDGHTLTTDQIPAHDHSTLSLNSTGFSGFNNNPNWMALTTVSSTENAQSSLTGGGNAHEHTLELRAKRVTTIVGTRNA